MDKMDLGGMQMKSVAFVPPSGRPQWRALFAAALIFFVAGFDDTVEARPRALFGDVPDQVAAARSDRPTAKMKRRVKLDLSALAGADLPEGAPSVVLNLFPDVDITAVKARFERKDGRRFAWFGKIQDDPLSMVVLTVADGLMNGLVFAQGRHFSIHGGSASTQEVAEVDQSAFPKEGCDQIPADQAPIETTPTAVQDALADTGAVIDVLVAYTPAARDAAGGTAAIQLLAQQSVNVTNTAYTNSGVVPRLNLVLAAEVSYTESADNISGWQLDLARLAGTSDTYMDDIHALRDTYQADVVVLLVRNSSGICGLANAVMANAATAFSLVAQDCSSANYSFGHEIGHLQGARHDLYVDPTLGSPFDYNHGHVNTVNRQRTVMAYNNLCADTPPGTYCTRVPYWSNPGVSYPSTAAPTGTASREHNTLVLNNTAAAVANFRQSKTLTVMSTYPAVGVTIAVSPADNNALGDGSTVFQRTYSSGVGVTLTAPATADSNPFVSWIGCASVGGPGNRTCTVTMNGNKTVTANYVRDLNTRPVASVLWSRSDTGQGALWEIDPGTNVLQNSVWLHSPAGLGAPWQATSYTRLDVSTGYVLWSRSDTGAAALWRVDPSTGTVLNSGYLSSATGVGGPWQATSYVHVSDTEGYVLWTRSDIGAAALWKINPTTRGILSSAHLYSAAGVGGPWQATSYARVSASEAYVLWTRSDTGTAALWRINPGAVSGTIPVLSSAFLSSAAGIGGPWQATGYEHVNTLAGYILWTRSDTGQGLVWRITPGGVTGTIPIDSQFTVSTAGFSGYPPALVGWQAMSYVPTNESPTLDALLPLPPIDEDAGLQTVGLSGISAGGGESQTLTVTAVSSNTTVIPNPAVIYTSPNAAGSLTFTPVANAAGVATITVTVNDGQSGYSRIVRTFTVTVTAVNDPPTDITLSSNVVDGGLDAGTAVGTLGTTDPDVGDTFVYTWASGPGDADNASFQIVGNQLMTNAMLDFGITNPYSIRVRSTDQSGVLFTEKIFTVVPPAYALWTRSDTGLAALWRLDPVTAALRGSVLLNSAAGVGAPWQATSFAHVNGTTGYVLWARGDIGQAVLWKVNPTTGTLTSSAYLNSSSGMGGPWLATSYEHVNDTTGYVLWTRSDTGQAALWKVDPSAMPGTIPITSSAYLYSSAGVGGPWLATSYEHVNDTTGYVLWTRSDTGQAALWDINPSLSTGPAIIRNSTYLYSSSGVGGPWQATSYVR